MNALDWLKNKWNQPAQGIASITAAVISFAIPPAEGIAIGESGLLLKLVRVFLIPVTWLILSVPCRRFSSKSYSWRWVWVSVATAICAIGIWFTQAELTERWTCHSDLANRHFTVGDKLNPNVVKGMQANEEILRGKRITEEEARQLLSNTPKCKLIERAEQDPTRVWSADEILFRRSIMSILYIVGIPIFVVAMISALQAWYCVGRRT